METQGAGVAMESRHGWAGRAHGRRAPWLGGRDDHGERSREGRRAGSSAEQERLPQPSGY
jgi:hypothetical protein